MCEHNSGKKENKYSKSNQRAETALASLDIGAATSVIFGPPLLEKSHDHGRQGQAPPINHRVSPPTKCVPCHSVPKQRAGMCDLQSPCGRCVEHGTPDACRPIGPSNDPRTTCNRCLHRQHMCCGGFPCGICRYRGLECEQGSFYKFIVSIHDGKGMNDIDSDEEQVPKEPRNSSNRRPKNQKLNRKEKTGIELVEIDVRRQQLCSEYHAETDHMFFHDIDLTMPALATMNIVVLRHFSPLPADHDLSRIRFKEESVKDGVHDTIDDGLVRALAIIAEFDAD
ncbi:hypothetical protein LTR15_007398 [Elasticomyces elasticus]|nr:hypothetical protein LTR15_007398 [Elasticomyces elasticus]